MIKKILPIVTIVLAVGLFAFMLGTQIKEEKEAAKYEEAYELRRPLTVKQEQLESKLDALEKEYEKSKAPNANVQVVFTELDEQVYTLCYPIMQEFEYVGMLAISEKEFPGEEGCMTAEQFKELIEAGWEVCITWQSDTDISKWWPNLQNRLTVLGVSAGRTLYFQKGTYSAELDESILAAGFTTAISAMEEDAMPLQLQYEEGVWHVGVVGLMSAKPRLWLREAVAQDANIAFSVGFEKEDELYNERSFRSMLTCFDEYEATDELVVTTADVAREQYYNRSVGTDPVAEQQYQEQKAALEAEIAEVKKQLEEINAMY